MATREQAAAAFWSHVNKDGPVHPVLLTACWEWMGAKLKSRDPLVPGYGAVAASGGFFERLAHRRSWEMTHGRPDLCVLHKCDNRTCVRPDHLFIGTYADNNRDMVAKGRHFSPFRGRRGEKNRNARLTDATATAIPARHAAGETQQEIAESLGVSQSTVSLVLLGKRWRHVTGIK